MGGWCQSTWGEEISLEYGKALRGYQNAASSSAVRVFGTNGPVGWTDKPLSPGPGVILGRKGAYRGVHYSREPFFVIDTAYYVKLKTSLDMRWVYYAMIYHKVGEIDDGSPIPSTTRSAVYVRDVEIPPIDEQYAIASILGALDDKIELNRRMNKTLEAMAQAIFKDWFVDFGPTRAKMEGCEPYLTPDLWSLFPDKLDNEGKPEGWLEKPLSEFFIIIGGGTPQTSVPEYWNGDIPWFSVVDTPTQGDVFVVKTEKSITVSGLNNSSARLVPAGTTIISARGTVGNLAICAQEMTLNQSCYALCGARTVGEAFVYLASKHMVKTLMSMAHGSVFSTITRDTFEALQFVMPSETTLTSFDEKAEPLFKRIKANVLENQILAQTRDLLLPKLMSGEIRLCDAEKIMKAAA